MFYYNYKMVIGHSLAFNVFLAILFFGNIFLVKYLCIFVCFCISIFFKIRKLLQVLCGNGKAILFEIWDFSSI